MNETGLLGRFLPEFGRIVGQTQFNMYHAYTVDEHTLQAIGIINDIQRGKLKDDHPLSTAIIHRIDDREALFLAMLLHDIGKGGDAGPAGGRRHRRAPAPASGWASTRAGSSSVAWLVRHHLVLSDYAQKRDVSDPETVRRLRRHRRRPRSGCALLLVLTVADIRAVGPGVWNGWKGQLMRELYAAHRGGVPGRPGLGRGGEFSPAPSRRRRRRPRCAGGPEPGRRGLGRRPWRTPISRPSAPRITCATPPWPPRGAAAGGALPGRPATPPR